MSGSLFESLLKELEIFFNCPLTPDENNACLIKMGIGLSVQIEMHPQGKLIVGCRIGTFPPGKFRDLFLKAALKSNDACSPGTGAFGFSTKTNHLIFFLLLPPDALDKEKIFSVLPPFIEKAKQWTEAAEKGVVPAISEQKPAKQGTGGLFGLL